MAAEETQLPPYEPWENPLVFTVMGSDSDLGVMVEAPDILDKLGVPNAVEVVSAHRTPELMAEFALEAAARGVKIVIAGAGDAAHLPGMIAAFSEHVPVIGVPVMSPSTKTNAAALSIEEMPPGVPVDTMAVNGAKNAGINAAQILGVSEPRFAQAVRNYRAALRQEIRLKRELMAEIGPYEYNRRMEKKTLGIPKAEDGVGRGGFLPSH
jgi:5-(carboxyamino)imidazole ribonucleotide mutase